MKERIKMIVFVLILGSILTTALVAVNNYTAPIIEKKAIIKTRMSILDALDILYTEDDVDEVFSKYVVPKEYVVPEEKEKKKFYISNTGEIAFEFSGSGVWGPIHGIVALLPDLETIKGIIIIHQEETPGLGGRISDKEYLDKFKEKRIMPELKILRPPDKASMENEVDGITGATLSCNAFAEILNSQLKKYIPLIEESK